VKQRLLGVVAAAHRVVVVIVAGQVKTGVLMRQVGQLAGVVEGILGGNAVRQAGVGDAAGVGVIDVIHPGLRAFQHVLQLVVRRVLVSEAAPAGVGQAGAPAGVVVAVAHHLAEGVRDGGDAPGVVVAPGRVPQVVVHAGQAAQRVVPQLHVFAHPAGVVDAVQAVHPVVMESGRVAVGIQHGGAVAVRVVAVLGDLLARIGDGP